MTLILPDVQIVTPDRIYTPRLGACKHIPCHVTRVSLS